MILLAVLSAEYLLITSVLSVDGFQSQEGRASRARLNESALIHTANLLLEMQGLAYTLGEGKSPTW